MSIKYYWIQYLIIITVSMQVISRADHVNISITSIQMEGEWPNCTDVTKLNDRYSNRDGQIFPSDFIEANNKTVTS